MTEWDTTQLLMPIAGDDPCGEALDYDLDFLALDAAVLPGGEGAERPDWNEVDTLGQALARRSKDLRIGVLLARAGLELRGFPGLRDGLELLAGYVAQDWEGVHPRPDAEDAADQTVRISALTNLCDPDGLLAEIRRLPLARSRAFGTFGFRDWLEAQRAEGEGPDAATVARAFEDSEAGALDAAADGLEGCLAAVAALDAALRRRVDATEAVRFEPLAGLLQQVRQVLEPYRAVPVPAEAPAAAAPAAAASAGSQIRDRNDVIAGLDRICQWYRANEPGSPVPMLLARARRLVAKDFLALLMDLAPDGAAQFRAVAGAAADGD